MSLRIYICGISTKNHVIYFCAKNRSILARLINIHEPFFWLACCFLSDARLGQPQVTRVMWRRRHNYVTALVGSKTNKGKTGGGPFKPAQIWLSYIRSLKYHLVVMLGARIAEIAQQWHRRDVVWGFGKRTVGGARDDWVVLTSHFMEVTRTREKTATLCAVCTLLWMDCFETYMVAPRPLLSWKKPGHFSFDNMGLLREFALQHELTDPSDALAPTLSPVEFQHTSKIPPVPL